MKDKSHFKQPESLEMALRPMNADDWQDVAEIYRQGIETGNATFQKEIPAWQKWNHDHLQCGRAVACTGGEIIGWAALSPVSGRCVYAGVAEVSVYVSAKFRGKHVGAALLHYLIIDSESQNIWTLQAGIFPENLASLKLHEQGGFRIVGYREKIGKMDGQWRNTVLLERRSNIAGID